MVIGKRVLTLSVLNIKFSPKSYNYDFRLSFWYIGDFIQEEKGDVSILCHYIIPLSKGTLSKIWTVNSDYQQRLSVQTTSLDCQFRQSVQTVSLFFKVHTKHCKNVGAMFCIEPEKRQSTFLGPLEWRNLFWPSNKVSSYEKLT